MSDYSFYIPASGGRRFAAFLVNFLLLGLLTYPFKYLGIDNNNAGIFNITCLFLILAFCRFPESPGKRILNLRILDEKKAEIGVKKRLFRAIPYLILFGLSPVDRLLDTHIAYAIVGIFFLFALVFKFADGLAVYFSPDGHSLLDMKLGTRVMTPRPIPGQENPTFMGVKLW